MDDNYGEIKSFVKCHLNDIFQTRILSNTSSILYCRPSVYHSEWKYSIKLVIYANNSTLLSKTIFFPTHIFKFLCLFKDLNSRNSCSTVYEDVHVQYSRLCERFFIYLFLHVSYRLNRHVGNVSTFFPTSCKYNDIF